VSSNAEFKTIYFPILRGLKGWRIPIINKNSPELFRDIKTNEEFKKLVPAQYHTWTAVKVFESNGIKVAKVSHNKGLYLMVDKGRVDYLPRSLLDVNRDLLLHPKLNLMLDPHILIRYPSAYYFYVNKSNTDLASDIKQGLEKSLKDGSFELLFNKAFGDDIKYFNLEQRKVLELKNPFYLDTMPIARAELWGDHFL
jgi:ABC-type amino acid transport substrate-binding protein